MSVGRSILVLNAGSSSLKFALFAAGASLTQTVWGEIENLDSTPHLTARDKSKASLAERRWSPGEPKDFIPDPLTTATVSNAGGEDDKGPPADQQPFPGKSPFHLLHIVNGRALIEDDTGMYVVRVGSVLPDNSRLASIEQRDGKWVIVTSAGDIYGNN